MGDRYICTYGCPINEQGYENDFGEGRLHHEIYLSDARRVALEKWKTVIRHPVKRKGMD